MKTRARVLLVLGAWAISGLLGADSGPEIQTVSGTVVSSGNISLVMDADDGRRMTLLIDTATTLPPDVLAPGNPIVMQYRQLDSALWEAVNVTRFDSGGTVTVPPPPPGPARPADEGFPMTAIPEPLRVVAALATLAAACLLLAAIRRAPRRAS